jgi:hypothetical protein
VILVGATQQANRELQKLAKKSKPSQPDLVEYTVPLEKANIKPVVDGWY